MRDRPNPQCSMLTIVDLEERVPRDHPLRWIKEVVDAALERLSPEFDRMYVRVGRALVPPERLLKASLLITLYSVRSERAFCEELEYNLLYRWFLDMDLMKRSFDAAVFTKNRPRLLAHDAGRSLFDQVVWADDQEGLLSDEHFSVDRALGWPQPAQELPAQGGSAGAPRRTPAPQTPRHACCARSATARWGLSGLPWPLDRYMCGSGYGGQAAATGCPDRRCTACRGIAADSQAAGPEAGVVRTGGGPGPRAGAA